MRRTNICGSLGAIGLAALMAFLPTQTRAEGFPPANTVVGTDRKAEADQAGLILSARFHEFMVANHIASGFRVDSIHLYGYPHAASPLGDRIAEVAADSAERKGWAYAASAWIGQAVIVRQGDDAILRPRMLRDRDGAWVDLSPILLTGMGPRSSMGPITSVKPW